MTDHYIGEMHQDQFKVCEECRRRLHKNRFHGGTVCRTCRRYLQGLNKKSQQYRRINQLFRRVGWL